MKIPPAFPPARRTPDALEQERRRRQAVVEEEDPVGQIFAGRSQAAAASQAPAQTALGASRELTPLQRAGAGSGGWYRRRNALA